MSGDITRISLDEAVRGDRTDWARLRALTEDEIEAAIAADPDTFGLEDGEPQGRKGASYRYELHADSKGEWRWRLLDANGEILAVGGQSFSSRESLEAAITQLREALLGA